MPVRIYPFPVLGGALLFAAGAATAAQTVDPRWALCPVTPPGPELPHLGTDATQISADSATAEGKDRSIFNGDVVVLRDGHRLEADEAVYEKGSDTLDIKGNVSFFSESVSFAGDSAHLRLSDNTGVINGARYSLPSAHAFGKADKVEILSAERTELVGASYTTCPLGHEAWLLDTGTMVLDRSTNTGEARDVTVRVWGVPVFYLPYINFALEGRKTGFLVPSVGQSQRNGTDLSLPWYWNIAPNRDATLTPRFISERGGMLMTEFRYLNPHSAGEIALDALPYDKMFGHERNFVRIRHGQEFSERWNAQLDFQDVSDPSYLNDIDNTLASSSALHLERRFDLTYRGDRWSFLGRLQDFQPLQSGTETYRRLPQLLATGADRTGRVRYDFRAEYVNFQNDEVNALTGEPVPTGGRVDLYPGVSLAWGGPSWFLTPRVAVRHTQYDLKDPADGQTPTRTLPVASIDSGVFFDRETTLFDTPLVQTLEPRLYYLYVPFRDQSELPQFDTTATTFSFDQLFRENRFTGADRMGDANQITAALTTRLLRDDTGAEVMRASIGQIHYFSDRKVTLDDAPAETRHSSDIAGELAARPLPGLEFSAATRWNPETEDAEESSARLRYRSDDRHVLDAAWRYRYGGAEISRDLLALWPVTPRWHVLGRWYYDLVAERTLESVVGIEYESCCWTARVVTSDKPYLDESGRLRSDRSIYFTLELKGLAGLGRSLESVIEDGMVGL